MSIDFVVYVGTCNRAKPASIYCSSLLPPLFITPVPCTDGEKGLGSTLRLSSILLKGNICIQETCLGKSYVSVFECVVVCAHVVLNLFSKSQSHGPKQPQKEINFILTGIRICAAWESRNASDTHVQISMLKTTSYFFPLTYRKHWECAPQCQSKEMMGELVVLVLYLTAIVFASSKHNSNVDQKWVIQTKFKETLCLHPFSGNHFLWMFITNINGKMAMYGYSLILKYTRAHLCFM